MHLSILNHPVGYAIGSVIGFLLFTQLWRWALNQGKSPWLRKWAGFVFSALSLGVIAAYGVVALHYLFSPAFFGHVEMSTSDVSTLVFDGHGRPLYTDPAGPARYSLVYGPMLFIVLGLSNHLLGPSVFASKLPCLSASLLSLLLIFLSIRKTTAQGRIALFSTALLAVLYLDFGHIAFVTSADALLLLAVSAGVFALTCTSRTQAIVLGLSLGVAINLKLHAPVYFIPIYAMAFARGWAFREIVLNLLVVAVTALFPFLFFQNISLYHYGLILSLVSHHGVFAQVYLRNIATLAYLMFPLGVMIGLGMNRSAPASGGDFRFFLKMAVATLLAGALISIPAAKPGSGPYHLMPLAPFVVFLASSRDWSALFQSSSMRSLICLALLSSWVVESTITAVEWGMISTVRKISGNTVFNRPYVEDINQILAAYPGRTILWAPADTAAYHPFQYVLVFKGMPIVVEPGALMDFQHALAEKKERSQPVFDDYLSEVRRESAHPIIWICEKDHPPFELHNIIYDDSADLFGEGFRADFHREYVKGASTTCFDLYFQK
jgi:hypothetical protein